MSLVSTLGKVAMGVMVAKGVGKMMGRGGGGGLGGLLGSLASGGQSGGGLGNVLGSLAGGRAGGIGDVLGSLAGGNSGSAGGLGGLLGGLAGGSQSGGGLGGMLDSLGGNQSGNGSLGDLFNSALQGNEPEDVPDDAEEQARVMLRAMISAAKADGKLDDEEQRKITEHLGDISEDDANFVREELQAPLDIDSLVENVPDGMEQQVYLMSLLAIDLDSKEEAVYLDQLAQRLNISHETSNAIHDQLGAPKLYS